jgi:hypothetical protein
MIDEPAIAVGLIIQISHSVYAQVCEVVAEFFYIFGVQDFAGFDFAVGAAGHGKNEDSIFALCSPTDSGDLYTRDAAGQDRKFQISRILVKRQN